MAIVSYEKILPPDTVSELITLGQSVSENSWRIGDIANECVVLNKLAGNDITHQDIYRAVGAFSGRASRTVRYYAEVADKFPKKIRAAYTPLSFSHFAFAMKYTHWEEILAYALANFDNYGRPATIDHLTAVFSFPEKEVESPSVILDLISSLKKAIYKIPMSGDVRRLIVDALQRIEEAVQMEAH